MTFTLTTPPRPCARPSEMNRLRGFKFGLRSPPCQRVEAGRVKLSPRRPFHRHAATFALLNMFARPYRIWSWAFQKMIVPRPDGEVCWRRAGNRRLRPVEGRLRRPEKLHEKRLLETAGCRDFRSPLIGGRRQAAKGGRLPHRLSITKPATGQTFILRAAYQCKLRPPPGPVRDHHRRWAPTRDQERIPI